MRITALYTQGSANAYYRVVLPLRELARRGHQVLWPTQHPPDRLLSGRRAIDVLLLHHFFSAEYLALVERLRRQGVAVIWDKDDDIEATPKSTRGYKVYGGRRGLRRCFADTVAIANAASLMTTPSRQLADRYREAGVEHVEVIENYVAQEHVGHLRPRHAGIVIGCTAGSEHVDDLKLLRIATTLQRLLHAHDGVRVVTIGCMLELRDSRYAHWAQVPIAELIRAEAIFDIGLAPLCDTPFNRARSSVKLKEYAAAGATWLASPVGPYAGYEAAQGGMLVAERAWYATLDELLHDHRRRGELTERARAWARTQSIDRAAGRWEAAMRGAVQRVSSSSRRGDSNPGPLHYEGH
jgi:hypothetical protein